MEPIKAKVLKSEVMDDGSVEITAELTDDQAEAAGLKQPLRGLPLGRFRTGGRRMGRSAALAALQAEKGRRASRRRVRDVVQTIVSPRGTSRILIRQHDIPRLTADERIANYTAQNGTLKLTPAQRRRLHKKAHRSGERTK